MRIAAVAAESAQTIAVAVLTAAGLRIGVPETVHATRQPIAKPPPGYATVEMAVGVPETVHATRQPIAKPHPGYATVEMAVEVTAITVGANAAVATTFAGTDDSKLGAPESRFTSTTGTTTAIVTGFAGGRELLEVLTGGADIASAVTGGEPDPRRGPIPPTIASGEVEGHHVCRAGRGSPETSGPAPNGQLAQAVPVPTVPYVPSDRERAALQRFPERRRRTTPSTRIKIEATTDLRDVGGGEKTSRPRQRRRKSRAEGL